MREGLGFSNFPKQLECNSRKMQGMTVEYTPNHGFTGFDEVEFDVVSQIGDEVFLTYAITVKAWGSSDAPNSLFPLLTPNPLKQKVPASVDSLKLRVEPSHAESTTQTQWPAVDDFLAFRAAPSSKFRVQDDLSPSEVGPALGELPEDEAQAQVTEIMKPAMDASKAHAPATPSESGASLPTAPNPPGGSADAIPTQEYVPMLPGGARAAMLIASPDNPQKPIVYLGSTVWSTVTPTPRLRWTVAVKADADIPDLKMHATMILRTNTDLRLQATHTIDLKFSFADGAPLTGFKDVGLPQMRKVGSTASEALTSAKAKIRDDYFLIALAKTKQDVVVRNLDLVQTRAWFDFPLMLNDGRIAKLVFQKSAEGEAMLKTAFDAWAFGAPPPAAHAATESPVIGGTPDTRYFTIVYGMIRAHLREPPAPGRSRGGAIVFTVDESGNLVQRKVVTPSGWPNLDMAAMAAIAEAAPYPPPPGWQPRSMRLTYGR
jgi:TonB family protein